jgi:UDP-3-O-[3-hydroxymyristoyl] glucosamine N-acyltransferase
MQFSATQVAMMLNGRIEGNAEVTVASFGKIEEAIEGQLAFLANPKYEEFLYSTEASIVIINDAQELKQPVKNTLIRVPDAYTAFATLLDKYQQIQTQQLKGIQQPAYIDATAKIGEQVFIGAFAYIGENTVIGNGTKIFPNVYIGNKVLIGDGTILHPGVKIYADCIIGKHVTIHAGTIIGGDGFGFAPQADGTFKKVPQIRETTKKQRWESNVQPAKRCSSTNA